MEKENKAEQMAYQIEEVLNEWSLCNMPDKLYDIHMHLIPEVDDGAWNMEMAHMMIQTAYDQGIRKIFATPHSSAFPQYSELIQKYFTELKKYIKDMYPDIELFLGSEVLLTEHSIEDTLEKLDENIIPSMNGTSYVLVEFRQNAEIEEAERCVRRLLEHGWRPIIAHAERYRFVYDNRAGFADFIKKECYCQVNVFSLSEEENGWIRENARWLLAEKRIDFLGSDAHRTFYRPPEVIGGMRYLYNQSDRKYADSISFGNAERMLCIKR